MYACNKIKSIQCEIAHSCKNAFTDKCDVCNNNELLPKRIWNYETIKKCWCCGNENVVIGHKCNNCGETI